MNILGKGDEDKSSLAVAHPRYLDCGTSHEASRVLALKFTCIVERPGLAPMHAFRLLVYAGLISPLTTRMAGPPIITTYPSPPLCCEKGSAGPT